MGVHKSQLSQENLSLGCSATPNGHLYQGPDQRGDERETENRHWSNTNCSQRSVGAKKALTGETIHLHMADGFITELPVATVKFNLVNRNSVSVCW